MENVILHDNAWPDTRIKTREKIASFEWITLLYSPYSPDLAPSAYHLPDPIKEGLKGKLYASEVKWKLQWWRGPKNSQQSYARQGYMFSFENGTLLLRQMMTMLRNRDVILRGPALFWCMIYVPVSIIIPVLKKKALHFDSSSYNERYFLTSRHKINQEELAYH